MKQCVLKSNTDDRWISWCGREGHYLQMYNYSFTKSLVLINKGAVCQTCAILIIKQLLFSIDKENLMLLI